MFATGGDKWPIKIFKEFLLHCLPKICTTGLRYLSCVPKPFLQVWYKGQPMEDSWKTFSNHSARKTVAKKLKTAALE